MAVILEENTFSLTDESGTQILDEAAGFTNPATILPVTIKTEILINGAWNDISRFVYQRDNIVITAGKQDPSGHSNAAKCTLTLNNRDGRFSPSYTGGAYYPYLQVGVQLRVSVQSLSSTGNYYQGYRFWGEVRRWPPTSDLTGKDVYVQVTAHGPRRRLRTGGGQGSALARYYSLLTGLYAPVAYWPCEEDSSAADPAGDQIGPGIDGGTSMTITTGTPTWKAISDFNGSKPIAVLNRSTWDGLTGSVASSGLDQFTTPGTFQWTAPVSSVAVTCIGAGGPGGKGDKSLCNGGGGGGGEEAAEAAVAVTVGNVYTVVVAAGDGSGPVTTFTGDAVTVTAHSGSAGGEGTVGNGGGSGGAGGTGSSNTTHHNGGAGAAGSNFGTPGGGGGSGGTSSAGNPASGFTGGAAVAGGGAGANAPGAGAGNVGQSPGGGGSGAAGSSTTAASGGPGAAGQVTITYTPITQPFYNVIRHILLVPKHGGNPGKVLTRVLTGGTVAKLELSYQAGGKLQFKGFASGGATLFDSGAQSWNIDGQTLMVSMELGNQGANIVWTLRAIVPGATSVIGTAQGTLNTASCGNVTEVIAAPNADITKTAMGHFSVQYAFIDVTQVSDSVNGHITEMGVDRFIRIATEEVMDAFPEVNETADHWGFEAGVAGWTAGNAALSTSAVWSSEGNRSLLITATGEAGQWFGQSPAGTAGQPVSVGDTVSVHADVHAPQQLNDVGVSINWWTAAGAFISTTSGTTMVVAAGATATVKVTGVAPATAAFFNVVVLDFETVTSGTLLYTDHVRVNPRMGAQTRKELHELMEEIEKLDLGLMRDAKDAWGLKYRTRIRMINQSPAVTLSYTAAHIAATLAPILDDHLIQNHIVAHRHKGSKVTVTQNTGILSVLEPPNGVGRKKKHHLTIAEVDAQLAALAAHLLLLGSTSNERYPAIDVNLARTEVANIVSVLAAAEIGDYVKITNLPFWFPSTTAKQLIIGYTETLSAFNWYISWNCQPELPWEIISTALRRW